ncbi:hypothetical protein LJR164_004626 [Phenylobacterium sp. LjRoot164]|uniref:hypothetical protein n=1 Tax=unclassified Phenylobacterium TaxID=2640670 RepID=UPI003ED0B4CC
MDGGRVQHTAYREQWLTNLAVMLRPWFEARGLEIPLRIRLGVGSLSSSRRVLGVCHTWADRDGFRHITISPFIDNPVLVAAVLVHELLHAILPEDEIHGRRFADAARAVGLLSPVTQVEAGPELMSHLVELVRRAGPYPHKAPADPDLVMSARRSLA